MNIAVPLHLRRVAAATVAAPLVLAGCGGPLSSESRADLKVVASFYPLAYVSERVAGEHADVVTLTSPGVEPHDLELNVRQTAEVVDADLVVYEKGLQPAVDEAVVQNGAEQVVEVTDAVSLRSGEPHDHEGETAEGHDGHGDEPLDLHFWLDPELMTQLAAGVRDDLSTVDPGNAADYEAGFDAFRADMRELDTAYTQGLADCELDTVVVSHDAFGYLRKYGLHFESIAGLSPDTEPSAAHLSELGHLIEEEGVDTVFTETLASPALADTLARRPRHRDRRPGPDRGTGRRHRARGLRFPHAHEPREAEERQQMSMNDSPVVAEIHDGCVTLGGRPILRGIDLTVRKGEVVALLGANGSGKSTLVRSLMGLVPVSRGEVSLFGTPLPRFRDWRRIGFVPQRVSATSGVPASVWEVVSSGRLSRRPFLRPLRKADKTAIRNAIAAVGLTDRTQDGCSTLSGGQQQRALIARALAGEPDLFVLDEPTAGVDLQSQQAFADALAALVARGATIILVAHELGPMAELVDRSVVMRDGRVAYDGPPIASALEADAHGWGDQGHHHPDLRAAHSDHTPTVTSPVDAPAMREHRP